MRTTRRAVLVSGLAVAAVPRAASAALTEEEVFVGPLPGWADVKQQFGAVGDGRADDTAALQRALDALRAERGPSALWLPAGTYRISRTLTLPRLQGREAIGLNIQGDHPDTTRLVWAGAAGGTMLDFNGWYSKLGRFTFDGAGRAGTGLDCGREFVTFNEIADVIFRDLEVGITAGGMQTAGIAETSVQRCAFVRCSAAGASLRNFNSLDWWFWHCRFEDCGLGLTNAHIIAGQPGAGNFHAYECLFERSKIADISIYHTGYFSFRDNVSRDSKTFFYGHGITAGAAVTLQRNRVFDTVDPIAVTISNFGPITLLDNLIVSRAGAAGPAVQSTVAIGCAVGNSFTVASPIALKAGSTVLDSATVARPARLRPVLPPTPPRYLGRVIEARPTAAGIQAAIDQAARDGGGVVHIPDGVVPIDASIEIPPNLNILILGEGVPYRSRLEWKGQVRGPVLRLQSPSRLRLRDIVLVGAADTDALVIERADQAGGRLWLDQVLSTGAKEAAFQFDDVTRTEVVMRDGAHSDSKVGVRLNASDMTILSGASSNNDLSYEITRGGRLLAKDIWYESSTKPRFLALSGNGEFVLNGSNIATPRRRGEPPLTVQAFDGRATFVGVIFTAVGEEASPALSIDLAGAATRVLLLGTHGSGEYLERKGQAGRAARLNSVQYTPGGGARPIADVGAVDPAFLRDMLAPVRRPARTTWPKPLPAGVMDVRLQRVMLSGARIGLHVKGR